jgi:hypothetical protein
MTEDSVWVANGPKPTIFRIDVKTNRQTPIDVSKRPYSGLAAGFGSVWVPLCGDRPGTENGARPALVRVDVRTNRVAATIPVDPANSEGGIVAGPEAVWMLTDIKGTHRDRHHPGGPGPRFLTVGAGSVWTLNQGDGTVSRVDTKSRRLAANIACGIPGTGGEIAFGEGSVWATVFQIPITRIDAATNRVSGQWSGPGGDSIRVAFGSVWLSDLRGQGVWRIDLKGM